MPWKLTKQTSKYLKINNNIIPSLQRSKGLGWLTGPWKRILTLLSNFTPASAKLASNEALRVIQTLGREGSSLNAEREREREREREITFVPVCQWKLYCIRRWNCRSSVLRVSFYVFVSLMHFHFGPFSKLFSRSPMIPTLEK